MLSASILGARPAVMYDNVSWSNGSGPIENGNSNKYIKTIEPTGTQVNLTITNLAREDAGLYTVTVMHEAGSASLQFMLKVLGKCVGGGRHCLKFRTCNNLNHEP